MKISRVLLHAIAIGFFFGLNLILGAYFLKNVYGYEAAYTRPLLHFVESFYPQVTSPTRLGLLVNTAVPAVSERIDIDSERTLEEINAIRSEKNLQPLVEHASLIATAESLSEWLIDAGEDVDQDELQDFLTSNLESEGYLYQVTLQSAVIGPYTMEQLSGYWVDEEAQKPLLNTSVRDVGIATVISNNLGVIQGTTVIVMAEPRMKQQNQNNQQTQQTASPIQNARPAIPEVSDTEVISALNSYRRNHGLYDLQVHPNLCQYAEKRVQDLVKHGGLDNHGGFRKDFEDQDNLPQPIIDYPGRSIGENLAHQLCRNMQTGEGFVAETGTALIEWCFDSSTKGHREAQLSSSFKNVCVRHADAMYVVIFGN